MSESENIEQTGKKTKKEKKENPLDEKPTNYQQIEMIMNFLGRKHSDGMVKGDNLTKILEYLINTKSESYDNTCSKLSLICGMMQRYIKENYLQGLEAFGIIYVYMNGNTKCWNWVGIK